MTVMVEPGLRTARCASLALVVTLLAIGSAQAGTTTIYKCLDQTLGVLYTDEPCKDGEQMNIRAGDPDPAAVARLERARDALDQSAAQRIADERRIAAQRDLVMQAGYGVREDRVAYEDAAGYGPYDYAWMWWYPGLARPHPHPHPPRSHPPRGTRSRHLASSLPVAPPR